MKLRTKHSPLVFLLLPSLAYALSNAPGDFPAGIATSDNADAVPQPAVKRQGLPTKDAPVDGRDGKPHLGPFVETENVKRVAEVEPVLKGRPDDPTVIDGKKIPETNDGVMFDKNREHAEEGTTGTEGGVTEKYKAKIAEEDRTGEKTLTQPNAPKEQPPLPHSDEQKIRISNGDAANEEASVKPADKDADDVDYTGLDKPEDLPDRPVGKNAPFHDTTTKIPVDSNKAGTIDEHDDGLIQPFHSFVLSFTMILFSEIGDKTFLVAALMAMKHDRMVVFTAAFGALLVMTVLSAVLGHAVPTLIPKRVTSFLAAGLFFVFGGKLMREGLAMDPNEGVSAEMHEVEQELAEKEKEMGRKRGNSVSDYTLEMGLNGNGNGNGRRSRPANRLASPARSPSQSPVRSAGGSGAMDSIVQGTSNLCSLLLSPAWVQTFIMTFLGEWGDRSQIATIAMAAGQDYWWVTLGATCGHAICTSVAVIGGRAIAGKVSLKVVTVGGAGAFLVFGVIYLLEALYS